MKLFTTYILILCIFLHKQCSTGDIAPKSNTQNSSKLLAQSLFILLFLYSFTLFSFFVFDLTWLCSPPQTWPFMVAGKPENELKEMLNATRLCGTTAS